MARDLRGLRSTQAVDHHHSTVAEARACLGCPGFIECLAEAHLCRSFGDDDFAGEEGLGCPLENVADGRREAADRHCPIGGAPRDGNLSGR